MADGAVLATIEKTLHETPNDPVALDRLATIEERRGNLDQAAKTYETALKHNPQNARLMLRLAELYSDRLRDPAKALTLAKEAHSLAPQDARISYTLGRLAFRMGDYGWAANLIEEGVRSFPDDLNVRYDFAWACYSVGRISESQAAMQAISRALPPFSKADEVKRFLLLSAVTTPAQAEKLTPEIQKSLTADKDYVPALMAFALVQEQHANFKEAAKLYERVLARYPLFYPATRNLAILCAERLGEEDRAYGLAGKAREAFPEDVALARTLGLLAY